MPALLIFDLAKTFSSLRLTVILSTHASSCRIRPDLIPLIPRRSVAVGERGMPPKRQVGSQFQEIAFAAMSITFDTAWRS